MFKASAALEKPPWTTTCLPPAKKPPQSKPVDPLPSHSPGDGAQRNPQAAGQALAQYLRGSPSPQGVQERLEVMAHFGIHTLDLSGQCFGAEAVLLLCEVFEARPALLGGFAEFNCRDARFDVLWPLLNVVKDHHGKILESLDFSGTRVLTTDATGATQYAPLEEADLRRTVAIVKGHASTLMALKLNQQTGLSPAVGARQLDHLIDPGSPMFALASALHQSAVETLELRDCDLWAADVNYLDPQTLFRGQPLSDFRFHSIDLRGNDRIFASFDSPVLQAEMVMGQAVGLARNPFMRALYLPAKALDMLGSDVGADALTQALAQTASRHLFKLEPFSSSEAQRFAGLNRLLRGHREPGPEPKDEALLPPLRGPLPPLAQEPLPSAKPDIVFKPVFPDAGADGAVSAAPEGAINANTAGQRALACLERQDDLPFIHLLGRMRSLGIRVLDFSHQRLSARAVGRLAGILARWPGILDGRVDALDFSDVELDDLEGLRRLIEVWTAQGGAGIRSLDFSDTRVRSELVSGEWMYQGLPRDLLIDIVGLAQVCPTLRVLKLNRQTALSEGEGARIDSLFGLIGVLGLTSLEALELRGCALTPADEGSEAPLLSPAIGCGVEANSVLAPGAFSNTPSVPWPSNTLKSVDLRDNEAAFAGSAKQASLQMLRLVRHLGGCLSLQEVYLPPTAIDALNPCDDLAFELLIELMESGHPHRFKLQADAPIEREADISLENMLEELNAVMLRLPVESSVSVDVFTRLHRSLSGLFLEHGPQTQHRRRRLAEAAGKAVGRCFSEGRAQGAIKCLLFMADLGIRTVCLKAQTLGPPEMACLAHVLNERPRAFTSFDFSDAEIQGSLMTVLAALRQQLLKGGEIASLDFSRTTIRAHPSPATPLSAHDLNGLSDLIRRCRGLSGLKLDHQPRLSRNKTVGGRFFSSAEAWPMRALVDALAVGSVKYLSLQSCELKFEDLQLIYVEALPIDGRHSPLQSIDLRGNSGLLMARPSKAIRLVRRVVKDAPNLRELYLPDEAMDLFNHDEATKQLTATLLKLRLSTPLVRLEPLSSSNQMRFAGIQELLAGNRTVPRQ